MQFENLKASCGGCLLDDKEPDGKVKLGGASSVAADGGKLYAHMPMRRESWRMEFRVLFRDLRGFLELCELKSCREVTSLAGDLVF